MFPFSKKNELLERDDRERVVAAIRAVEAHTTGEVRVFIESYCEYMDAIDRAKEIFSNLKMYDTERHNAVLVYVALLDHQFAIYGDENAYNQFGGSDFWENAGVKLVEHFKKGKITEGIVACIEELGSALKTHFPFDASVTKNELPDEIVFGK